MENFAVTARKLDISSSRRGPQQYAMVADDPESFADLAVRGQRSVSTHAIHSNQVEDSHQVVHSRCRFTLWCISDFVGCGALLFPDSTFFPTRNRVFQESFDDATVWPVLGRTRLESLCSEEIRISLFSPGFCSASWCVLGGVASSAVAYPANYSKS